MTTALLSYHNDPAIKAKYVARFAAHRAADQVIQGQGFLNGRGCFIGCTLDRYDPKRFSIELGWPQWLVHLADAIFEWLPESEAPQFGTDLHDAVPVGVDLDLIRRDFKLKVQQRSLKRMQNIKAEKQVTSAIKTVIALLKKGEKAESAAWSAAYSAAGLAAYSTASAWSAAESAAWSAAWSSARSSAGLIAYPTVYSAENSAEVQRQRDDLLALCRALTPDP